MPVTLTLHKRPQLWTQKDARGLANDVAERIVERTGRGVGADGKKLTPLKDGSPSTLYRTGRLMQSVKGNAKGVVADVPYAEYVDAKRPFLGLTKAEEEEVGDALRDVLDKRLGVTKS